MFWGLPVIVAVLPTLDAIATASRYGTGLRRNRVTQSRTSGATTRHIASLTRKAEKKPETRVTAASSRSGCRARIVIQLLTRQKNPESRTLATIIIMPSNSAIVSTSIARYASSSDSRPVAAIRLAPRRAAPARSEIEARQLADRD